jgi:nitrite reductase/ring-hydroxylating ferredoxin subunit
VRLLAHDALNTLISGAQYWVCDNDMQVEVAMLNEIPTGTMKRVRPFDQDVLLSNVGGKAYATQNSCGHQRASLARGTLQGSVVTCPLHGAKFDVTTGKNAGGIQLSMPPELVQKIPQGDGHVPEDGCRTKEDVSSPVRRDG